MLVACRRHSPLRRRRCNRRTMHSPRKIINLRRRISLRQTLADMPRHRAIKSTLCPCIRRSYRRPSPTTIRSGKKAERHVHKFGTKICISNNKIGTACFLKRKTTHTQKLSQSLYSPSLCHFGHSYVALAVSRHSFGAGTFCVSSFGHYVLSVSIARTMESQLPLAGAAMAATMGEHTCIKCVHA
jgi:hypothetical protein